MRFATVCFTKSTFGHLYHEFMNIFQLRQPFIRHQLRRQLFGLYASRSKVSKSFHLNLQLSQMYVWSYRSVNKWFPKITFFNYFFVIQDFWHLLKPHSSKSLIFVQKFNFDKTLLWDRFEFLHQNWKTFKSVKKLNFLAKSLDFAQKLNLQKIKFWTIIL